MKMPYLIILIFVFSYAIGGAVMNWDICQEAVNKGADLKHCWFKQYPDSKIDNG
jgi:hypothetical protein